MNNKQALIALGTIAAMLVILVGGVKLGSAVFASGNHSPSTSNTGTSSTNPFGGGQRPRFGNGRPGFGSFLKNAAIGQVSAVHGNTITVAGFRGGSNTTVTVTSSTKFQKGSFQSVSPAKLSDIKGGNIRHGSGHQTRLQPHGHQRAHKNRWLSLPPRRKQSLLRRQRPQLRQSRFRLQPRLRHSPLTIGFIPHRGGVHRFDARRPFAAPNIPSDR